MGHIHDWSAYMAGALFALFAKWWAWIHVGHTQGKTTWTSTKEWFDVTRSQDQASWAVTVLWVWVGGYAYLNSTKLGWEWVETLPVVMPFASLLGFVNEYTAPAAFKWVLGKLPWGQGQ